MHRETKGAITTHTSVVLLVDVANVVGSRPDGWWRDRAGATTRLLDAMAGLAGAAVAAPDGQGTVRIEQIVAVLEGAARSAVGPEAVSVVRAPGSGDDEIVAQAHRIAADGRRSVIVTADRGLRARLPETADITGPGWLNRLLDRSPPGSTPDR